MNWVMPRPGTSSFIHWGEYKPRQAQLLRAYQTVYNASLYGWSETLQPSFNTPGGDSLYRQWKDKILNTTMQQGLRMIDHIPPYRKPTSLDEWPEHLWEHLYHVVQVAGRPDPPPPPPPPPDQSYIPDYEIG